MKFIQHFEPQVEKPLIIAAMQDMGNVGSIVIDFINKAKNTDVFRSIESEMPPYVIDKGGHIEIPKEVWEYRCSKNLIVFGGGAGQPQTGDIHEMCRDVMDVAKKYSVKFIYTVGGFHTERALGNEPKTFVTSTSKDLSKQLESLGVDMTPQSSIITGFNGLILGYAKINHLQGIGLYGELNEPAIPQYRTAKSIIKTLEKLTYQNFGSTAQIDALAETIDREKMYWKDSD